MIVSYVRLYSDEHGDSHFEDCSLEVTESIYAPPAPTLLVSRALTAGTFRVMTCAPGWYGDWHPAPARQFMMLLSGEVTVETSDGEIRVFGPGLLILVEDTEGRGHRTRNSSSAPFVFAVATIDPTEDVPRVARERYV